MRNVNIFQAWRIHLREKGIFIAHPSERNLEPITTSSELSYSRAVKNWGRSVISCCPSASKHTMYEHVPAYRLKYSNHVSRAAPAQRLMLCLSTTTESENVSNTFLLWSVEPSSTISIEWYHDCSIHATTQAMLWASLWLRMIKITSSSIICFWLFEIASSLISFVIPSFVSKCFESRRSEKYVRKIIETYTSTSAPLARPKNLPTDWSIWGKKVKRRSQDATERKTKKCRALKRCFFAISREIKKRSVPDIMKKKSRRFI